MLAIAFCLLIIIFNFHIEDNNQKTEEKEFKRKKEEQELAVQKALEEKGREFDRQRREKDFIDFNNNNNFISLFDIPTTTKNAQTQNNLHIKRQKSSKLPDKNQKFKLNTNTLYTNENLETVGSLGINKDTLNDINAQTIERRRSHNNLKYKSKTEEKEILKGKIVYQLIE